ncbi:hypothetical protein GOBAR_DD32103 [Gossypium barbadense]|nr:hypothetical protein GOBAR_DD32103 [Gossypium barbadense]
MDNQFFVFVYLDENRSGQTNPIELFAELADVELDEDFTLLGEKHGVQDPYEVLDDIDGECVNNDGTINASLVKNPSRGIVIYKNPGAHMSIIDPNATHVSKFSEYLDILPTHSLVVDFEHEELFVGQKFATKKDYVFTIKRYSMNVFVDYKVVVPKMTLYIEECWRSEKGCAICRYELHLSRCQKYHRKLDAKTIYNCIMPMVKHMPAILVSVLIAKMQEQFHYQVSYQKAWIAKQMAMKQLYRDWDASYNELQGWIVVM